MEFLLAYLANARGVFIAASIILGLATVVLWTTAWGVASDDSLLFIANAKRCLWGLIPAVLLACVPTIDDLWQVRISLIKYELAAPENVQKATDEIARIGKKLECKYLGGCEAEKK